MKNIKINKQLILKNYNYLLQEGAFDIDLKAKIDGLNIQNAASRLNFEKNPIQYFTNWFINGPLRHLPKELYGKILELIYKIIKDKDSKDTISIQEFKKELEHINGPWNKEITALRKSIKFLENANAEIKNKHFIQYIINPFVSGKVQAELTYAQKQIIEELIAKYGDGNVKRTVKMTRKQLKNKKIK